MFREKSAPSGCAAAAGKNDEIDIRVIEKEVKLGGEIGVAGLAEIVIDSSRTGRKTGVKERVFKGPEKLRIQSAERTQYPSRAKSGSSGSFGRSMKATGFQAYPFPHLATFFPASRVREGGLQGQDGLVGRKIIPSSPE